MDANARRPWYRLHWGTVLTVFFVGVAWAGHAFPSSIEWSWPSTLFSEENAWDTTFVDGWPMICIRRDFDETHIDGLALAVDCLLAVACLAAVAFVAERLERVGLHFRLSTLLTIVTVFAVLCAFWRWDAQLIPNERFLNFADLADRTYIPLAFTHWYSVLPVLVSLGCLVYTAIWLTLRLVSWPIDRRRRSAPAKGEADGNLAQ